MLDQIKYQWLIGIVWIGQAFLKTGKFLEIKSTVPLNYALLS